MEQETMQHNVTLQSLPVNGCARVKSLGCDTSLRRRLMDLGLVPGTLVQCVQASPFGDPVAYCVRGAVIALRGNDAQSIQVTAADVPLKGVMQ